MTAFGLVLAMTGIALWVLGFASAFLFDVAGWESVALANAVMVGVGYGFVLAVVGSTVMLLSVALYWYTQRARACPMWRSAP